MLLKDSWPAVSQICSLMFFSWIWIVRAPNSTPIVRSCCWRNLLSVNWRSRQDLPTPRKKAQENTNSMIEQRSFLFDYEKRWSGNRAVMGVRSKNLIQAEEDRKNCEIVIYPSFFAARVFDFVWLLWDLPVSPMIMYLNRYAYDIIDVIDCVYFSKLGNLCALYLVSWVFSLCSAIS